MRQAHKEIRNKAKQPKVSAGTPYMPGLDLLGRTINVFDVALPSRRPLIFDLGTLQEITAPNGKSYVLPEYAEFVDDHASVAQGISVDSINEFLQKVSAELGLTGTYKGFTGEFFVRFSHELWEKSRQYFSRHRYVVQSWMLYLSDAAKDHLLADFTQAVNQAVKTKDFVSLFEAYGTHYVSTVAVGGIGELYFSTRYNEMITEIVVHQNAELTYKAIFEARDKFDFSRVNSTFLSESKWFGRALGGKDTLGPKFRTKPGAFEEWVDTVAADPVSIGYKSLRSTYIERAGGALDGLQGVWNLVSNAEHARLIREAYDSYAAAMDHTFAIVGGAKDSGHSFHNSIIVGGVDWTTHWPNNRDEPGLQLCILNRTTLQKVLNNFYSTYWNPTEADRLAKDLTLHANPENLVMVCTCDTGWRDGQLNGAMVAALKACGGGDTLNGRHDWREPFCLIGIPHGSAGFQVLKPHGSQSASIVGTLVRTPGNPAYIPFFTSSS